MSIKHAHFPAHKPKNFPQCPVHKKNMEYKPADDKFKCSEAGCKYVARQRYEFSDIFDAKDTPATYRGTIEVVQDRYGGVWLFLVDVNALVDISSIMELFPDDKQAQNLVSNSVSTSQNVVSFSPPKLDQAAVDQLKQQVVESMARRRLGIVQRY